MIIYTLKSCDTCKKALKWLQDEDINYHNVDIRADGLDLETTVKIVSAIGWEVALNRRSTTWRNLGEAEKENIDDEIAVQLILKYPTLMKRPVFINESEVIVGFDDKSRNRLI